MRRRDKERARDRCGDRDHDPDATGLPTELCDQALVVDWNRAVVIEFAQTARCVHDSSGLRALNPAHECEAQERDGAEAPPPRIEAGVEERESGRDGNEDHDASDAAACPPL